MSFDRHALTDSRTAVAGYFCLDGCGKLVLRLVFIPDILIELDTASSAEATEKLCKRRSWHGSRTVSWNLSLRTARHKTFTSLPSRCDKDSET